MIRRKTLYLVCLILVLLSLLWLFPQYFAGLLRPSFKLAGDDGRFGFKPVDCWFTSEPDWPYSECYFMLVPENHGKPGGRVVSFPVVVFRSKALFSSRAPVLHLGGGGPGAPMNFNSAESVRSIWEYHDEMSLKQGRDLFAIDPRGSGLSQPLLSCDTFVDHEIARFKRNISFKQEWDEVKQDYYQCIDRFEAEGIDISTYNSLSIARDIETMRTAANVDQWVFIGVSYGANYAQIIAAEYPGSVESMVLDSATFPNLKGHHNFVERTMAPFLAVYAYCDSDPSCDEPIADFKQRFWKLHKDLNANPVNVEVEHNSEKIPLVLNGERYLAAVMEGVYGVEIFADLPRIIAELEARKVESIMPYLEYYVAYMLDRSYGDVSAAGHYCYEDKPFTDFKRMTTLVDELPLAYIREIALLTMDWPDYCDRIQTEPSDPVVAGAPTIDIPTLFLHGELDTITPLSDVLSQKQRFKYSQLVSFSLSHSILTADECAELVAADFVRDYNVKVERFNCQFLAD